MLNFRDAAAAAVDILTLPVRRSVFQANREYAFRGEAGGSKFDQWHDFVCILLVNTVTLGIVPTLVFRDDPVARDFLAIRKSANPAFVPTPVG